MNGIDVILRGAAHRLDRATAHTVAPEFVTPQHRGGRIAAGITCVAAVAVGGYGISVRDTSNEPTATYPPGLLEGNYGERITLTEVPDGDNDPETFILQASPSGGDVTVTKPVGTTTAVTVASGEQQTSPADLCVEASGAGGYCRTAGQLSIASTEMMAGPRGSGGQVVVTDLPVGTFAVTMKAGFEAFWVEPLHGVAIFPFPATATSTVTTRAVDADGAVIWTGTATNGLLTPVEVNAAVVTKQTPAFLADGYFGEVPDGYAYGPEVIRRHGRTVLTGFAGPFAAQGYIPDPDVVRGPAGWIWAITVLADDLGPLRERIDLQADGAIAKVLEPTSAERVVIWAGDDIDPTEIDRFESTLVQRAPRSDRATVLDEPRAWEGAENTPLFIGGDGTPWTVLFADVVGEVDGHDLIAQADDLGVVMFRIDGTSTDVALVGGSTELALPGVDQTLSAGLMWPVPADITAVTITLDDGSVVTPEVVDLAPLADAKLLYLAPIDPRRTIASVEAIRN